MMEEPQVCECASSYDMGLAPGGRMGQVVYEDPYRLSDWDQRNSSRCFVHIANAMVWHAITNTTPPTPPPTAQQYAEAGLPWFDWYDDTNAALPGADTLAGMQSVARLGQAKGDVPLPENAPAAPGPIVALHHPLRPHQVREWQDADA